jgi:putative oxidoreductase
MQPLASLPKGRADDLGSLFLRVGVGVVFAWHGWIKFHDLGVANFAKFLGSLNVPAPEVVAWLQTAAEGVGGLMLIVGLFTRYVTLPLIAIMIGAIWLVKVHVGFIMPVAAGAELETALLAGLLGLLFIGPGRLSLDFGLQARSTRVSKDRGASVDA